MLSHDIYALLDTKHSLQILETDVSLHMNDATTVHAMLRNVQLYGPLRIWCLTVHVLRTGPLFLELFADLCVHKPAKLYLWNAPIRTAEAAAAVADAVVSMGLKELGLCEQQTAPDTLPALTRMIATGQLRKLHISDCDIVMFEDGESVDAFCAALEASALPRRDIQAMSAEARVLHQRVARGAVQA